MGTKEPRIGPKMIDVLEEVAKGTHHTKHSVAVAVGPHHSNNYGDRTVMRCVKAGLVTFDVNHPDYVEHSLGVPVLTKAGCVVLADKIVDDVLGGGA